MSLKSGAALGAFLLFCVAATSAEAKPSDNEALIRLEKRWVAAIVSADLVTLDRVFADTYVDTDEAGDRADKAGVIAALKSGELKMTSIQLSDMQVRLYRRFAVVTGASAQSGAFEGHPVAPKILFTDSFVQRHGTWRAVASQRTAAPA
jgi:hypothetical protein